MNKEKEAKKMKIGNIPDWAIAKRKAVGIYEMQNLLTIRKLLAKEITTREAIREMNKALGSYLVAVTSPTSKNY